MAKTNRNAQMEIDKQKVNDNFDIVDETLNDLAMKLSAIMPLVADSLQFTRKLVKLYRRAFNAGLEE